jgi:hypothetical protein
MSTASIKQPRMKVKRRPQRGAAAWPAWTDDHVWECTPEYLAPLAEELEARERELDAIDGWAEYLPSVIEACQAAQILADTKEDRSALALATISQLRDEAGLVRSIINPALAVALANDAIDLW